MSTDKSSHNRAIAKSAGVIGLATLCSRLLGFMRDVVIARLFGIGTHAQAFVIAFKIPNLFRDLLGEGASNAALVPVFSEYTSKHTKQEFWELANVVFNILLVLLMSLVLLGILLAPFIVRLIAPGFVASPEKLETTVRLTRIIFPYLLLICLAAYSMGVLNSLRHFSVPAFAPCLLNISIIVFALIFGEGIKGLAFGVLTGGLLQLAVQVPVLYGKGFRPRLFKRFKHPAAKTIARLMFPRLLSSGIYQLNNFVDSIFASLAWIVGEGAVAILYFSYRLILFPLGIFSTSLSQAILPEFSSQAQEDDVSRLKHTLSWGLRATFFIMLPASAGLMALSSPIVLTLFGAGKFGADSVRLTAEALLFYSIGLSAYSATRILQSCFFAFKDTVTPTKISVLALALNIALNSLLMFPMKAAGIALATSISGINTSVILFFLLRKRIGDFDTRKILFSFFRILFASACMGLVSFSFSYILGPGLNSYINLGLSLASGALSYIAFCFVFGVPEIHELWQWLSRGRKL